VGGRNILPMSDLRRLLEDLGYADVRTYIQSGNVVFKSTGTRARELPGRAAKAVEAAHGFRPSLMVLSVSEIERAMESNPFPDAQADPKSLHLYFLAAAPKRPDLNAMESIRSSSEKFSLLDRVFYLHAPDGIARSKLASSAERHLGVAATARNWRSVSKVVELAGDIR
jgi:uncharacterized protein (DUF1697 family)